MVGNLMSRARMCMEQDNVEYLTTLKSKLQEQMKRLISISGDVNALVIDDNASKLLSSQHVDRFSELPIV